MGWAWHFLPPPSMTQPVSTYSATCNVLLHTLTRKLVPSLCQGLTVGAKEHTPGSGRSLGLIRAPVRSEVTILRMAGTGGGRTRPWDRRRVQGIDEEGDPGSTKSEGAVKQGREGSQFRVLWSRGSPSEGHEVESTPHSPLPGRGGGFLPLALRLSRVTVGGHPLENISPAPLCS